MSKDSPCYKCTRRHAGCGAKCQEYNDWRKEHEEERKRIREEKYKEAPATLYTIEMKRKTLKRKKKGK